MGNNPVSSVDPDGGLDGDPPDKNGGWLREVKIYAEGIKDGARSTFNYIQNQFTWRGYAEGLANTFTFGSYSSVQNLVGAYNVAKNIPNYTKDDYIYGAGIVFEKGVEFALIRKVSSVGARGIVVEAEVAPTTTRMSDVQLLTRAAQKAETAIGGQGGTAGTLKHTYAKNLLSRYQSIYGDRGLSLGSNYFNGPAGKGFLDVVNHNTMMIYDFKFGNATMSNAQYSKYSNSFPGYGIQIIRP
jgi:hypothetical protein